MTIKRIESTSDLSERINQPNHVLLDVRPIAAYNGWALHQERRGGHIKGAKMFPRRWFKSDNWQEILTDKGIGQDTAITVYGYDEDDTGEAAKALAAAGYNNLEAFEHFVDWSANADLPMEHLPRFQQLVYPEWIKSLINGNRPPHYDGRDFVIGHASYRYREDYEAGHIPGAVHVDTESLETPDNWNRRTPEELRKALTDLGIRRDTMVILYGRFNHPNNEDEYPGRLAGHLAAIRCALIMMYAGVEDVRILNGGMASWRSAGYDSSPDEAELKPVAEFGTEIPANPDFMIDTPEAKKLLAADDGELVSIRSWAEFVGNVSGYNYIEKAGRIPGAIFGNCGSDAYHMENYRNFDHTMREYHEIANIWTESGITPDKHIAFYCGTGWRASEAFLNAYLMGWSKISVYDGGWLEWKSNPDNPIEIGVPADQTPAWERS